MILLRCAAGNLAPPNKKLFRISEVWTARNVALAGQLIADSLQKALSSESVTTHPTLANRCAAVRQALSVAHFRLRQESEFLGQEPKACSFLGLLFNPEPPSHALCLHAGTCRLYRLREVQLGEFRLDLLTGDHVAPASREFESHLCTAGQTSSTPPILTRSVGKGDELSLEEIPLERVETGNPTEPERNRRSVFLPVLILFAMVSFSIWMIWGGRSKPTEPGTEVVAVQPNPKIERPF